LVFRPVSFDNILLSMFSLLDISFLSFFLFFQKDLAKEANCDYST